MGDRPEPASPSGAFPAAVRALRRAMAPRLDRRSAEVWFAEYPYRQDPDAVRRERAGLIAFLARHGVPAEADDELDNSPAVQLGPGADLDWAEAVVEEWVAGGDHPAPRPDG
jgi:hypothetical protein